MSVSINSVRNCQTLNNSYSKNQKSIKQNKISDKKQEIIFVKSQPEERNPSCIKANKYTIDMDEIRRIKTESEQKKVDSFVQMARDTIGNQNTSLRKAVENLINKTNKVTPEMIEQAKIDIAQDGYWSIENTSDRIFKFAKAISGDNPEKEKLLKEAFLKGYQEAEKTWGGSLPEICQRTKQAVLEKFENWKREEN